MAKFVIISPLYQYSKKIPGNSIVYVQYNMRRLTYTNILWQVVGFQCNKRRPIHEYIYTFYMHRALPPTVLSTYTITLHTVHYLHYNTRWSIYKTTLWPVVFIQYNTGHATSWQVACIQYNAQHHLRGVIYFIESNLIHNYPLISKEGGRQQ